MVGSVHSNFLSQSPLESKRFNLNIFRLADIDLNSKQVLTEIINNKVDVVIFRPSTNKTSLINQLIDLNINIYFSEPLIEYSLKTASFKPQRTFNADLEIINYTPLFAKELNSLTEKIFKNYELHYSDNPFLDSSVFLDGYKEWIDNCVKNGKVWLLRKNGHFTGFFSAMFKGEVASGAPGGILPEFEGTGQYWDFHSLIPQLIYKEDGIKLFKTSTKCSNMAVIKQWDKLGWSLTNISHTIHIAPMLNQEKEFELKTLSLKGYSVRTISKEIDFAGEKESIEVSKEFKDFKTNKPCRSFKLFKPGKIQIGILQAD